MRIPEKGEHGYTDAHKRAQLLKTFLFFLIPIAIFVIGYVTTDTKRNILRSWLSWAACRPARSW